MKNLEQMQERGRDNENTNTFLAAVELVGRGSNLGDDSKLFESIVVVVF